MLKIKDLYTLEPLSIEHCNLQTTITGAHFDSRKCLPGFLYIALKGANSDGHMFIQSALNNGAVAAIVDRDYQNVNSYPVIYANSTELFFADAANLWRQQSSATIIGITGTNGKTSTKEMVNALLSKKFKTIVTEGNFNNHLGVPLTLFRIQPETEIAIIEMGTNHYGEIKFLAETAAPQIGLITNVGCGHLEGFGSINGVLKAKLELFDYLKTNQGLFLVNNEDKLLSSYCYDYSDIKRFGLSRDNDFSFDTIGITESGMGQFTVDGLTVTLGSLGTTGCKNALAAMAIGNQLGLSINEMCDALQGFGAANKRGEIFKTATSTIIIDCYNANPSSMQESVGNLLLDHPENSLLVLGDMLEMGDASTQMHQDLGFFLKKYRFGRILLLGNEMQACAQVLAAENCVEYFGTDFVALQNRFEDIVSSYSKVLLKGSRGMSLERVLENLTQVNK